MPKKAALPALADENAAKGGIATLDRALSLLGAFTADNPMPTLTEIADHARVYKSTVLRMLASLEHAYLVHRRGDGRYALGAEVARLHSVYAGSFSMETVVVPVLQKLVDDTQESASYYVPRGDQRLCLFRVDSPRPVRDHRRVGELLPIDRGAGGRVLLAFAGATGEPYERIRREGVAVLSGDRTAEIAGIAAPVFGADGVLDGALTLTMPSERSNPGLAPKVVEAAQRLSRLLGGRG